MKELEYLFNDINLLDLLLHYHSIEVCYGLSNIVLMKDDEIIKNNIELRRKVVRKKFEIKYEAWGSRVPLRISYSNPQFLCMSETECLILDEEILSYASLDCPYELKVLCNIGELAHQKIITSVMTSDFVYILFEHELFICNRETKLICRTEMKNFTGLDVCNELCILYYRKNGILVIETPLCNCNIEDAPLENPIILYRHIFPNALFTFKDGVFIFCVPNSKDKSNRVFHLSLNSAIETEVGTIQGTINKIKLSGTKLLVLFNNGKLSSFNPKTLGNKKVYNVPRLEYSNFELGLTGLYLTERNNLYKLKHNGELKKISSAYSGMYIKLSMIPF
jgi:hypothetical protein